MSETRLTDRNRIICYGQSHMHQLLTHGPVSGSGRYTVRVDLDYVGFSEWYDNAGRASNRPHVRVAANSTDPRPFHMAGWRMV